MRVFIYNDNKVISTKSVFFEKLIEHRFIADMMMYGWFLHEKEIKILRSEIDSSGYDIVIDCENVYRHIQLKTSEHTSKRSSQKVNTTLLNKKNPCIIWILYNYNTKKRDFDFRYLFWGSDIDGDLPDIKKYSIVKTNSKKNEKAIPHIRNIPKGHFVEMHSCDLFNKLFIDKNIKKKNV
ncbi:MAG: hypothetical protein LBD07_04595 [Spirochaetaceae bacterium]|nr:hypothetical protein [Spirochaetaceae bacterium]